VRSLRFMNGGGGCGPERERACPGGRAGGSSSRSSFAAPEPPSMRCPGAGPADAEVEPRPTHPITAPLLAAIGRAPAIGAQIQRRRRRCGSGWADLRAPEHEGENEAEVPAAAHRPPRVVDSPTACRCIQARPRGSSGHSASLCAPVEAPQRARAAAGCCFGERFGCAFCSASAAVPAEPQPHLAACRMPPAGAPAEPCRRPHAAGAASSRRRERLAARLTWPPPRTRTRNAATRPLSEIDKVCHARGECAKVRHVRRPRSRVVHARRQ
jgi:hypothetical protein